MRLRTEELLETIRANKVVLLVTAIASVISSLVFVSGSFYPHLNEILPSSANTPWGIVTSIFLHADFQHLSANMMGLWIWAGFVMLPDSLLNREQSRHRLSHFLPVVLGSAIVTNILWLLVAPHGYSRGASGLVFAISGVALGYSLMNLLKIVSRFRMLGQQFRMARLISALMGNLLTFVTFFILIVFFTNYFLAVGPGINSFAHGVAFLMAFIYTMGREYIPYLRVILRNLKSRKTRQ